MVGKFVIPIELIILHFQEDENPPIILGILLLPTGGALIDVREGKLTMRLEDEEPIFKVYKVLNITSQYKELCMINVIEWDKCGVASPPKVSSNTLIKFPKLLPSSDMMQVNDLEKAKVKKYAALKCSHQRGLKIIRR